MRQCGYNFWRVSMGSGFSLTWESLVI